MILVSRYLPTMDGYFSFIEGVSVVLEGTTLERHEVQIAAFTLKADNSWIHVTDSDSLFRVSDDASIMLITAMRGAEVLYQPLIVKHCVCVSGVNMLLIM